MHILQRKSAAIGARYDFDNLAHGRNLQPKHIINENWSIHIGFGEAIGFRIKFGVLRFLAHVQRIKVSS